MTLSDKLCQSGKKVLNDEQKIVAEQHYARIIARYSERLKDCPWIIGLVRATAIKLALHPYHFTSAHGKRVRTVGAANKRWRLQREREREAQCESAPVATVIE